MKKVGRRVWCHTARPAALPRPSWAAPKTNHSSSSPTPSLLVVALKVVAGAGWFRGFLRLARRLVLVAMAPAVVGALDDGIVLRVQKVEVGLSFG